VFPVPHHICCDLSLTTTSFVSLFIQSSVISSSSAVPFPTVSIPGSGAAFQTYFVSGAAVFLAGLAAVYIGMA
jgi:hypothetical protein